MAIFRTGQVKNPDITSAARPKITSWANEKLMG
jgi:hypothetical protein